MAESKRNSVAGKVATPKTAGNSPTQAIQSSAQSKVDTLQALEKSIGARIKLTTTAPVSQSYEGILFTACPILNVIAINVRASAATVTGVAPGDYHIIPVARIQTFQIVSLAATAGGENGFMLAQPPVGPADTRQLRERERIRITKLKQDEANRGKGVTKEAQAIFDSFKRINMSVRWHNQEIVVHDAVIVAPPYRVEDCKGTKDKQEVLSRVRKVLEGERRKLREREERDRRAATPAGARKGG